MNGVARWAGCSALRGFRTAVLISLIGGVFASSAFAEGAAQADPPLRSTFADAGEGGQLGGASGMAVNRSGAGGVSAGTLYAVTQFLGTRKVAEFIPGLEGGLEFGRALEVRGEGQPYQRCGLGSEGGPGCSPQPGGTRRQMGIDVDQVTGNVYVFAPNQRGSGAGSIGSV